MLLTNAPFETIKARMTTKRRRMTSIVKVVGVLMGVPMKERRRIVIAVVVAVGGGGADGGADEGERGVQTKYSRGHR
jgi:hypothetical protein